MIKLQFQSGLLGLVQTVQGVQACCIEVPWLELHLHEPAPKLSSNKLGVAWAEPQMKSRIYSCNVFPCFFLPSSRLVDRRVYRGQLIHDKLHRVLVWTKSFQVLRLRKERQGLLDGSLA